ncbi:MAG: flagellar hook-length control protein FliK [Vulcanibacillus sp.]
MEQFVINPTSKNINQNTVNETKKSIFSLDTTSQAVNLNSFGKVLTELINGEFSLGVNDEQTLLFQITDILQTSDEINKDLISWFNGLSEDEQLIAYQILNNISLPETVYSSFDNEEVLQLSNMTSNQDKLNIKSIVNSKDNFLDKNQKELQKILPLIEDHNIELKTLLDYVQKELTNNNKAQNLMLETNKNFKGESIVIDNQTINLQSIFSINNLQATRGVGISDNLNQDVDIKTIDLSQLQFNSNNIYNDSKFDIKVSNTNQNLQSLFVDENFVNEFGKILIKNLKLPNGSSETKIQLQPSELGKVNVNLTTNNGQMSAQIVAETIMGKELLESQIHQLKQSLTLLGYQVEKIEVQQATNPSSANNNYNSGGFEFTEQQLFQQQKNQQSTIYSNNFIEEDEEIMDYNHNISGIDYIA